MKFAFLILAAALSGFGQTLGTVEAVEYDSAGNRYFISNSTSILIRNAQGQLSTFGNGPVAKYGMEILGGNLYASNGGNNIRGYKLEDASQVMNYNVPGASFLNGMATDGRNTLYATDFSGSRIYSINVSNPQSPTSSEFVAAGSQANGIIYEGDKNRLLFVNWGSNAPIKAVDLTTKQVTIAAATSYSNCDGIARDKAGNYYISCWGPQSAIYKFASDLKNPVRIGTNFTISNPADIDYNGRDDILAVPNAGNVSAANKVVFIPLNSTSVDKTGIRLRGSAAQALFFDASGMPFLRRLESGGRVQALSLGGRTLAGIPVSP